MTIAVAVNSEHPPAAAIVYVTVYVPPVLAAGVMAPDEPSSESPAGAVNMPPGVPVNVTFRTLSEVHHGEPEYDIEADGAGVTVICLHPPAHVAVPQGGEPVGVTITAYDIEDDRAGGV